MAEGARAAEGSDGLSPLTPLPPTDPREPAPPGGDTTRLARLARLSRLIDALQDQPPDRREAWLAALPPADADLHGLLVEHLAILAFSDDDEDGARGTDPAASPPQDTLWRHAPGHALGALQRGLDAAQGVAEAVPGSLLGPWRLIEPLGRGGMGEVWRAERADGAYQRQAALKLPLPGLGAARLAERFARERDILAGLAHPHIARFYDAGVSDRDQPYLVLELVAGQPITRHADAQRLGVRARVGLLLQVLAAVQHAHNHLVVHRDLKPGNIQVGDDGQVHLLDFGIARLLDDSGNAPLGSPDLTEAGSAALTPTYAAPEQVLRQPVATSADLYALGVVLYELLTGVSPYRPARPTRAALEEAILQDDPVLPSRALAVPAGTNAAALRGTSLADLRRTLAGDLDAIVLKALAKAPAARYASADAMAQDLQRWLDGLPVQARPVPWWARWGKQMRRHRLASAALAMAVLALLGGLAATLHQARRADAQRALAVREGDKARAVKDFLVGLFDAADPAQAQGRTATVTDLMRQAEADMQRKLADQPELRAAVMGALVEIYNKLEDPKHAIGLARQRVALLQAAGGLDLAMAQAQLGLALQAHLDCTEALAVLVPAEPVLALHLDQPEVFAAAVDLGRSQANCQGKLGRHAEAVPIMRRLVAMETDRLGADDWETLFDRSSLAIHLAETGARDEVVALAADLQPRLAAAPADRGVEAASIQGNLGGALETVGDWQRASDLLGGVAQRLDALEGPTPSAALAQAHLGNVLLALDRHADADAAYADAHRRMLAVLPGNAQAQAMPLSARVRPLLWLGRPAEALAAAQAADALVAGEGVEPRHRATVRRRLALALLFNGRAADAQALLQHLRAAEGDAPSAEAATTLHWLAGAQLASVAPGAHDALARAGAEMAAANAAAAEALWRRLPPGRDNLVGAELARLTQALARARGGSAAEAQRLADAAEVALKPLWPADHAGWALVDLVRAAALRTSGHAVEAQALAKAAADRFRQRGGGVLLADPPLVF